MAVRKIFQEFVSSIYAGLSPRIAARSLSTDQTGEKARVESIPLLPVALIQACIERVMYLCTLFRIQRRWQKEVKFTIAAWVNF